MATRSTICSAWRPSWAGKPLSLDLILSVLVLAAVALIFGAVVAWRRGARQKAVLMLILAGVAALNVGIWTVPDASGAAPLGQDLR